MGAVLIVGLGNPGPQYELTRHNLGFLLLDELADRLGCQGFTSRCQALYAKSVYAKSVSPERTIYLAKPQTFMNLSGGSVACLLRELDIALSPTTVLVAHDDIDLDRFRLRLRSAGGHGGHNGLRSLFDSLGSKEFGRIRMGVGRPPGRQGTADYVLERAGKSELEGYGALISEAADAVEAILSNGLEAAMTEFNSRGPVA